MLVLVFGIYQKHNPVNSEGNLFIEYDLDIGSPPNHNIGLYSRFVLGKAMPSEVGKQGLFLTIHFINIFSFSS